MMGTPFMPLVLGVMAVTAIIAVIHVISQSNQPVADRRSRPRRRPRSTPSPSMYEEYCMLCLIRPSVMKLIPCNHVLLCEVCSHRVSSQERRSCPDCGQRINAFLRLDRTTIQSLARTIDHSNL